MNHNNLDEKHRANPNTEACRTSVKPCYCFCSNFGRKSWPHFLAIHSWASARHRPQVSSSIIFETIMTWHFSRAGKSLKLPFCFIPFYTYPPMTLLKKTSQLKSFVPGKCQKKSKVSFNDAKALQKDSSKVNLGGDFHIQWTNRNRIIRSFIYS